MDNPKNRSGNFRIAINTQLAGRGYGTEATAIMLEYGFGILNLHRIDLDVYSINERAIHVYEKVGFKREGVLRDAHYYNNTYYDTIIMSILEDEYRSGHAAKRS
ncbi:GNAT family N-acetyltransferase [Alicyclobacillus sp. SO9]|uniref:GNAT family N-acetyltransferase n=1 Tax=Alicyclobacillus sp. SO9 TaxID=2665646 RepID=UPI00351C14DB